METSGSVIVDIGNLSVEKIAADGINVGKVPLR